MKKKKKDKVDIWQPIYWADYSKDTDGLSLLEHGAYMLLMRAYWNNGGPLPATDRERLYRNCRAFTPEERQAIDYIIANYFQEKDENLIQKRLDQELKSAKNNRKAKAEAGRKSGEARRAKAEQNANSRSTSVRTVGEQKGNPTPSPTPPPGNKDKTPYPLSSSEPGGVLNKFKDWKIIRQLSERQLAKAKAAAPGLDIYELGRIYDEGVEERGIPDRPGPAFIGWIKSYTKNIKV